MAIWAIADLHLSFGVPNKSMDVFGPRWHRHAERVKENWIAKISDEDLVLLAGDISWAKHTQDALADLNWIDSLPGTKVMVRGNHDYWWDSIKKLKAILPSSLHIIQNNAFDWHDVTIGGSRLWDTPEYNFDDSVEYLETTLTTKPFIDEDVAEAEKIYTRELARLELSLKCLNPKARMRLVMTHYPPIGPDLKPSRASRLLSEYKVDVCVFGHLHNVADGVLPFGSADGVRYILTACDYIHCDPVLIPS